MFHFFGCFQGVSERALVFLKSVVNARVDNINAFAHLRMLLGCQIAHGRTSSGSAPGAELVRAAVYEVEVALFRNFTSAQNWFCVTKFTFRVDR